MKNLFTYMTLALIFMPILLQCKKTGSYFLLKGITVVQLNSKNIFLDPKKNITTLKFIEFANLASQPELYEILATKASAP